MQATIITFCLIGAVFANPISLNSVSESSELDPKPTTTLLVSQSSENDTSELQSSEEKITSQNSESSESESLESTSEDKNSESESLESTSEDKTSEESQSDSQSDESDETNLMAETRDNSMSSEENVRKNWAKAVPDVLSANDNSMQFNLLVENPTGGSDVTNPTAATSDSTESTSSESNETSETSETSQSSEMQQLNRPDCVNGTQSCESEEYFFQDIGDDGHYAVDHLMVPDDAERLLSLRR